MTDRVRFLPAVGFALPTVGFALPTVGFALPAVGMTWGGPVGMTLSGPAGPLLQGQAETENALAALFESVLLVNA